MSRSWAISSTPAFAGPAFDEGMSALLSVRLKATGRTQFLADITKAAQASKQSKPEAILLLDKSTSGLRLLVFSDGGKEGAPRPILVPAPDTAAAE